jgi:hypothetical protein
MLIYLTDYIELMTALMVECVGYIVCGGRWANLVVWGYGLTVPTRNRSHGTAAPVQNFKYRRWRNQTSR